MRTLYFLPGSLKIQYAKNRQKFAICAPSDKFVGYISSQLRHVATIGKKLVKQQYLLHMFSEYGELRPTSGWEWIVSLGHPSWLQLVWRLGGVTAPHSSSGRQPNFAALNRGRHLYSAGRPSRWASAHILVLNVICMVWFWGTASFSMSRQLFWE